MKTILRFVFRPAGCALLLTLFIACSSNKQAPAEADKQISLADSSVAAIVAFDTVRNSPIENELNLTGKVTFNEDNVAKVYPLVSGNVQELKVELGDFVQKGQILAILKSGDVAGSESQLVTAQSNLTIAQKNLDAVQDMYKSGIAAEKEFVSAQKEVQKAEAELNRAKEVLTIYGGGKESLYYVKAPISGYIVEKNIARDMQIRPDNSTNLFTISDLNTVWVVANVFESDIAKIKLDCPATITTLSYPDKKLLGKIDKIFNVLDPQSKTMKIRIKLDNQDLLLKPEMFANIHLRFAEGTSQMLTVTEKALVFDKSKNFVMIANGSKISTREVEVYNTSDGRAYISKGLAEGEKVICKSQLYIYDALND